MEVSEPYTGSAAVSLLSESDGNGFSETLSHVIARINTSGISNRPLWETFSSTFIKEGSLSSPHKERNDFTAASALRNSSRDESLLLNFPLAKKGECFLTT